MNSGLVEASWVLLFGFGGLGLVTFVLLVLARVSRDAWERRRGRRRDEVRTLLFGALMGEPEEAHRAATELSGRTGRAWTAVADQGFEMLPKIKGESRAVLVEMLLAKGAARRARSLCGSFSAVRRCRGAYALGSLGQRESVAELVPLLSDRHFLVRRVTVRALGNIRAASAVGPLLNAIGEDARLSRDLVFALDRIGPAGAAGLRAELQRGLDRSAGGGRHADLAVVVLGHIGDVSSVPMLAQAMQARRLSLAVAAAEALGRIGSPDSIPFLVEALVAERPEVRSAAARALGGVGSPMAADSLLDAVDERDPVVSREAAEALVRLHEPGLQVLRTSDSPYAVEALAMAALRGTR
ncbi:MAG: HEAT repeat domain-containing protein [Actinomycetota bacterium]|nr:HEAT repeat domain-containing protein [Actinomycetota bacterium]